MFSSSLLFFLPRTPDVRLACQPATAVSRSEKRRRKIFAEFALLLLLQALLHNLTAEESIFSIRCFLTPPSLDWLVDLLAVLCWLISWDQVTLFILCPSSFCFKHYIAEKRNIAWVQDGSEFWVLAESFAAGIAQLDSRIKSAEEKICQVLPGDRKKGGIRWFLIEFGSLFVHTQLLE